MKNRFNFIFIFLKVWDLIFLFLLFFPSSFLRPLYHPLVAPTLKNRGLDYSCMTPGSLCLPPSINIHISINTQQVSTQIATANALSEVKNKYSKYFTDCDILSLYCEGGVKQSYLIWLLMPCYFRCATFEHFVINNLFYL